METLVGTGHRAIFSTLRRRFDSMASGSSDACRVVILEGASGVGKSRLVREF